MTNISICKYIISSENWLKILNANPYFGTPLGEQETKDILTIGILMIYLGTVDEKGHANIHHTWYYYDPSNNKLYACSALNESPKNICFFSVPSNCKTMSLSVSYYLS